METNAKRKVESDEWLMKALHPQKKTKAKKQETKKEEKTTKNKKEASKLKNASIVANVLEAVAEAEKRIGSPLIYHKEEDIYYRWSSLGRAKYIDPKWQFLSNMSPFPIKLHGTEFPTVEHYFHIMKWIWGRSEPLDESKALKSDPVIAILLSTKDPVLVKQLMGANGKYGKMLAYDEKNWKIHRPKKVELAVRTKVDQHPGIRRLLLESGTANIAERKLSHRRSTPPTPSDVAGMVVLWKGDWYGNNSSGKLWMKIREEIKEQQQ